MYDNTKTFMRNARATGLACGLISVALGIVYLLAADAPSAYIIVNVCAAVIGVGSFIAIRNSGLRPAELRPVVWLGMAAVLLGTTIAGVPVDGASRWLRVGAIALQPSLIFVPAMLVAYSQGRSPLASFSIILAAIALALQPDRAMAAVIATSTIVLAFKVRERLATSVAVCAVAGFAVTLYRADRLPAVPYVDGILFTAFDLNIATGIAVVSGAALLFLPAALARSSRIEDSRGHAVFGVVWLTIVAAAALGNYPTPLVGYGGSAIVGYFLSLAFLPKPIAAAAAAMVPRGMRARDKGAIDDNGPHESRRGSGPFAWLAAGAFSVRG